MLGAMLALLIPATGSAAPTAATAEAISDTLAPAGAELISDANGPIAYRERAPDGNWLLPQADAVLLDEAWWTPLRPLAPAEVPPPPSRADLLEAIRGTRLTAWSVGDVTLDGVDDLVVSFRRPFRRNHINATRPRRDWVDGEGLSAHLGLYRPDDLSEIWVAGTLVSPVVAVAACDGGLAVAYGELDGPGITETGAWRWVVFGFVPMAPLPGPGTPTCVDIDGDGRTEPAITGRSSS
jgi:hypothetical protein